MKGKMMCGVVGLLFTVLLAGCASAGEQNEETEMTLEASSPEILGTEDVVSVSAVSTETDQSDSDTQQILPKPAPPNQKKNNSYGGYQQEGGEVAFVLEGSIEDGSFNQAIYEGIQMYAFGAGVSFSYYLVEKDGAEGYQEVIERAVTNQARLIVCAGYSFGEAVGTLQSIYPDISFLMIDGVPVDADGNTTAIGENVHCVTFREEESGYLAGYFAVMEGHRSLGFIGGEKVPSVVRYGYGYLQGISDATEALELEDVAVNYWYSGAFRADPEVASKAADWYADGTEVIFACGGALYESVLEAAQSQGGLMIGVDRDQSALSDRFLTSAIKDLAKGVIISLDDYYAVGEQWSDAFAGQEVRYGIQDNCAGIPVLNTEWRFQNVSKENYYEVQKRIKKGEIIISDDTEKEPRAFFPVNDYGIGE